MIDMAFVRRQAFFALLFTLLVALAAGAASATEIQRVRSPGGIEAWLVEDNSVPLIAMQFAFTGGSTQDPAGKAGVANLVSGLLDEGAGPLDAAAFQERREELAARMSFSAGQDVFFGSVTTLTANTDPTFELLRLALNEPRFDEQPVERVRAQVATRIRASEQDPNFQANQAWLKLAFGDHPYANPVTGTLTTLDAITQADLRDYVGRIFARGGLKIGVVGDIDAERLGKLLDEVFGALPAEPKLSEIPRVEPTKGPVREVIDMKIPQTVMQFGFRGLAREDKDFIPAYIVNHILGGGGFSSRLYKEVREKRGLAYSVYSFLYPLDYSALWLGGVATQNARAGVTLETIEAELKRLAEEGPSEAELADAKSYLTGSYALRFDTSGKIARQLVAIQLDKLGIDYINTRNAMIDAVSIDDVKRVAAELLKPDQLLVTVVGQPDGLTKTGSGG